MLVLTLASAPATAAARAASPCDDDDGDGVCDDVDVCSGDDASGDTDGDGVCDDVDPCPLDASDDSDGDLVCDSDDRCRGNDASGDSDDDGVCDDVDSEPFLFRTRRLGAGSSACELGGVVIEAGIDENSDGSLAIGEVTQTAYVCDGVADDVAAPGAIGGDGEDWALRADDEDRADGYSALTRMTELPQGQDCERGGLRVESGLDYDANGKLESDEVARDAAVCNGSNGSAPLIVSEPLPRGDATCPNGGSHILIGLDDGGRGAKAGDGELDPVEVDFEDDVCLAGARASDGDGGCSASRAAGHATSGIGALLLIGVLYRRRLRAAARRG